MIAAQLGVMLASSNEAKWEGIRRAFSGSPNEPAFWMLVGVLFGLSMIILIASQLARQREPAPPTRVDLLKQAIDVLRLTEAERRTLLDVAQAAKLNEPVSMLITPVNLEYALRQALHVRRDATLRPRVQAICQRIHEENLPKEIPPEPEIET